MCLVWSLKSRIGIRIASRRLWREGCIYQLKQGRASITDATKPLTYVDDSSGSQSLASLFPIESNAAEVVGFKREYWRGGGVATFDFGRTRV